MKFSQIGRVTLASVLSLAMILGMTSCTNAYTIAYLYVTSAKSNPGGVSAFKIDYDSGALNLIADSPFPSGGRNPVGLVVAPNNSYVYVINRDDNNVVEFAIGTDGKLYSQHTYNTTGSFPTSIAMDASGKFLLVAFTYRPGFTNASPGPGGINVWPINNDGSLGTLVSNGALSYFPVGVTPVGINVTKFNNFVYVVDQGDTPQAQVVGYSLNKTSGALTLTPGCSITPTGAFSCFAAGVQPSAIASEATSRYVYVTDQASNQLIGYVVQSTGALVPMLNGPFRTDLFPVGLTVDPRGKFLYVVNYNAATVNSYAIDGSTGNPAGVAASTSSGVFSGPTCVTIEPSRGLYLYTSNFLDNSISGKQLDPHTGALIDIQNTPFPTSAQPTCSASAATGDHATQAIQP